jgi:hypothetical protein
VVKLPDKIMGPLIATIVMLLEGAKEMKKAAQELAAS